MGTTHSTRRRSMDVGRHPSAASAAAGSGEQGGGYPRHSHNPYGAHYPAPPQQQHPWSSSYGGHRSGSGHVPPRNPSLQNPMPPYPHPGQAEARPAEGGSSPEGQLQQTSTIRNAVNLKKESLKLVPREGNPDVMDIHFTFDSTSPCSVTTFVMATEETSNASQLSGMVQPAGERVMYQKGLGLVFPPPGQAFKEGHHSVVASLYKKSDLCMQEGDRWPLIIRLETAQEMHSGGKTLKDLKEGSAQPLWVQSQTTFATIVYEDEEHWKVKVNKQKIWVAGVSYELQEIYGMESAQGSATVGDVDDGSECVICMVNRRDTTVLPCRHMCMCSECANLLRHRTNRCPICRDTVESLLHIKLQSKVSASRS